MKHFEMHDFRSLGSANPLTAQWGAASNCDETSVKSLTADGWFTSVIENLSAA